MQESYIEGLVLHDDPESCVYCCKAIDEALTGAHAGRVLSRENCNTEMLTPLGEAESYMNRCVNDEYLVRSRAVGDL